MIKLFLTIFLNVLLTLFNIITTPINLLIQQYFPDIDNYISDIIVAFQTYVFPIIGWFFDLLPTSVFIALLSYLNTYLLINWYFEPIYKGVARAVELIKKLPLA